MLGYAILSFAIDLKVLFYSNGRANKFILFMALGFLLLVNIMALYKIAGPLGNAAGVAKNDIDPLFRGLDYN